MASFEQQQEWKLHRKRTKGHKYVTWDDYSREQLGRLVQFCLTKWRGVLLSVTPSEELLTVRVYGDEGTIHVYGRTLQECEARLHKKAAIDWEAQEFYSPIPVRQRSASSDDSDTILADAPPRTFKSMEEFEGEIMRAREQRMAELRQELRERFPRLFKRS